MTPRALLAVALCCAAVLFTGCGKQPAAKKAAKPKSVAIVPAEPLESLRADTEPGSSARRFVSFGEHTMLATDIHREYINEFIDQSGNGIGRPGPRSAPQLEWTELVATQPVRRERVWQLLDRQLVSVNAPTGPAVYIQSPMRVSELATSRLSGATAETMRLDAFETQALKQLRAGDEVVLQSDDRRLRMLGAIRARKECLDCHDKAKEGDLLGAFTYTLGARPEEHRPTK